MVETRGALEHLRILDLSGPEGQPAGRYLADLGAEVVLVEPPSGSPSRRMGPFGTRGPELERSLYFLQFNTNKRSIVLDLETVEGRDQLRRLSRTADAVIESYPPGHMAAQGLGYEDLAAVNPGLVLTSITPFGQTGPYRDFQGADIVLTALGGLAHSEGEAGGQPLTMPRYQAYHMGGIHAAFGTLMALWHRERTGEGQHVDVSLLEVASHMNLTLARYSAMHEIAERRGSKGGTGPSQYYRTKDGWVMLALTSPRQWKEFAAWVGDPFLMDPKLDILSNRDVEFAAINERAAAFIAGMTTEEYLREGLAHHVTVAPANSVSEFAKHPHTAERGFFVEIEHPVLGRYPGPGAPGILSATPWAIRCPAPTLGQHTAEVLREVEKGDHRLGPDTPPTTGSSRRGGAKGIPSPLRGEGQDGGETSRNAPPMPLDGIRVVAFSRAWAAPFGTRFLADYGAEVVKIESTAFPEGRVMDRQGNPAGWIQSNSMYAEIHRNKLSITLDLHTKGAQELFKRLVAVSDIVVENNAPNAMPRFGLGYEDLKVVKPEIIMVSCPGYGSWGPMRDFVSVGQCLTAFTGLGYLWGQPGSVWPARGKNAYPDFITSANLNLAVMAALHHRRLTGEGQHIELPQFQATAAMIGLAFLEENLGDTKAEPWGNRDPNAAPQGMYPCRGEDRWCAISCQTDEQWRSLASLIGKPDLAKDSRYVTREARHACHDELDELIAAWTRTQTAHQVMYKCQRAGVPAGIVSTGEDLYLDPHLRERDYVVGIDHPAPGRLSHPGMTVRFTKTPGRVRRPAPLLGQHTEEVLTRILGLSAEEIARYRSEGALR